jgi:hypothetical protein
MASSRARTAPEPSQCLTAPSMPPNSSANPTGGESGMTRQWYIRGKLSKVFPRTQLVVMVWVDSSRQAPNPAEPRPYW